MEKYIKIGINKGGLSPIFKMFNPTSKKQIDWEWYGTSISSIQLDAIEKNFGFLILEGSQYFLLPIVNEEKVNEMILLIADLSAVEEVSIITEEEAILVSASFVELPKEVA